MTSISTQVGAAAALFAFLSVLVGLLKWRWGGIDSELEREQKIERLLSGKSVTTQPYRREEIPENIKSAGESLMGEGSFDRMNEYVRNPEFGFNIVDVITTENSGFFRRMIHGFKGETRVRIQVRKHSIPDTAKLPPDVDLLGDFESREVSGVCVSTYADDARVVLTINSADEARVEATVDEFFSFVNRECGSVMLKWNT